MIRGFTRILGKPLNWSEDDHGRCGALAILDVERDYAGNGVMVNSMISAWDVTPDELARLNAGAPVYLRLLGTAHTPVGIWVGDAPINGVEPTEADLTEFQERVIRRIGTILQYDPACNGRVTTDTINRLAKFVMDARQGGLLKE